MIFSILKEINKIGNAIKKIHHYQISRLIIKIYSKR